MLARIASGVLRFIAASQALGMVLVHAFWLLALSDVLRRGVGGELLATLGNNVLRAYEWLGGVGLDGKGDETHLMIVWGKLSLVIYVYDALVRAIRGERAPIALWRLALGSGGVALVGLLIAIANSRSGLEVETVVMACAFGLFGVVATFWGVGAWRLADAIERHLQTGQGGAEWQLIK